jgi:hypothetical protein
VYVLFATSVKANVCQLLSVVFVTPFGDTEQDVVLLAVQASVLVLPTVTVAGVAAKLVMAGGGKTPTVTVAVDFRPACTQVSV